MPCFRHLSHDNNNGTLELASQEKVVETGACCKVKRVLEQKRQEGKDRSHAVLHQGAACPLAGVLFILA